MARQKIMESKNSRRFAADWESKVNIFESLSEYCSKFINMLRQFWSMWDGHLERISIAKHRIKLL